jgi:two-component system chemotaxis sensor kinase CheA
VLSGLARKVNELHVVCDQQLLSGQSDWNYKWREAMRHLDKISNELKALVRRSFMQPIGTIWMRLPRVARDIAASQGKQVRLDVEGHDIQVDRRILEAIKDPLIHLVRNAIDHGIETPDGRRAAGKSIEGSISLLAFHGVGQVTIEVADDGAGIDLDRVRAKALGMGLITEAQASVISNEELASLIFVAGLPTVQRVTKLSGRGVGMDIVRTNVERIGGTVVFKNCRGKGLKVTINVPLTVPAKSVSLTT